jgi:acyl transferase domain-containing protein/NAD(P)H-dependent flavin oxidoreductase YrpB (nitropropane dioxygenase family)
VAEVRSREAARRAAGSGFGALVVAGNEAGGHGGDDSSFILLQAVAAREDVPVWVRGGIGLHSAAACVAAGAAGVVLDGALLLARESPLDEAIRARVERWDGGESVLVGRSTGAAVRVVPGEAGTAALPRLRAAADSGADVWSRAVRAEVGWARGQLHPAGQDAALAAGLAQRFVTAGGIVQAVERAIEDGVREAHAAGALAEASPLARSHGTRYPIVQGPMTRVSDTVAFAAAVAGGGAVPFLALALMRGADVRSLLDEASAKLAGQPWGVGILGFVPPELRKEQIDEIRRARPAFALIAGGRPDQAAELERSGVATYLHAPSPGLLRQYWNDGARRFVLEGRECGGHVGPRSSLVLWEQSVAVLLEALDRGGAADELHVLFAGGIHDDRSAAAVAALAAPLTRRGARVGVLVGTAYLFTAEAVSTGAIVSGFQAEALDCGRTVLLETGPGHEVRVSPTPFTAVFEQERARLLAAGQTAAEVRALLEGLNAGRLRIAAKGIERSDGAGSPLIPLAADAQRGRGLYMLGQAATLRDQVTTIATLHHEISAGGTARLAQAAAALGRVTPEPDRPSQPSDVAIIGMSAIVPDAADVRTFWENTLRGHDAITEVPADRWDWRLYYDPDPRAPDKITSKWGGFVPDIPFDPLRYGMPPTSLPSIEPMHLLTLEAVRAALDDAGYRDRPFPRERTAVVLGAGGGAAQLAMGYAFRSYLPLLETVAPGAGREALQLAGAALPEWTEDSFPGILLNVAAGRVANRFDLGGSNYTVDAACGSSLAAASLAVRELESGAADMVILGGADTVQNPFTYLAFSKTHAFSPRGRCRPFDSSADGIVISEGVAVLVLKRLADAERDGDRIYAVIKGIGASSDGRAKGLTAPRPEGQISALGRAYAKAAISPATVGYVEAHGTGTAAGDLAEVGALNEVFAASGAEAGRCALGSVKSQIGHTKCAAGLAGLINASLALYHEVLPPTIGVAEPNPRAGLDESPFHISTRTRPWLHAAADRPRRAGVSAFGFGGTNFHAVLEAYDRSGSEAAAPVRGWPAELLVWRGADRKQIADQLDRLARALDRGAQPALRDLAHTLYGSLGTGTASLAIVTSSLDELRDQLTNARRLLTEGTGPIHDPSGIDFTEEPASRAGRIAFLFPGQGSQRPEMLGDLAVHFPEVRRGFEAVDRVLLGLDRGAIGPRVFPPPAFRDEERRRQKLALAEPEVAQPALAAASIGLLRLLQDLGAVPDFVAGHSFGELVALYAAGVLSLEALAELAEARGRFLKEAAGDAAGAMAALAANPDQVGRLLAGLAGVAAVNFNGPSQTVISGTQADVDLALTRAREAGVSGQRLNVACAFHSPLVASASAPLVALAQKLGAGSARCPVYSNVTAGRYTDDPAAIAGQLGAHLASPVRFAAMIETMHADGARLFVEVGPGSALTGLVGSILGPRPHQAIACEPPGRPGVPGLLRVLGRLFASGAELRLDRLTRDRAAQRLDLDRLSSATDLDASSPSTWLVNGSRARPLNGPEPARLGPAPARPAAEVHVPDLMAHAHSNGHGNGNGNGSAPRVRSERLGPLLDRAKPAAPPHHRNGSNGSHAGNGKAAHPASPPLPAQVSPPAAPGMERVVEAFQQTMRKFLEVQRETMLGFLSVHDPAGALPAVSQNGDTPTHLPDQRTDAPAPVDLPTGSPLSPVADQASPPAERTEPSGGIPSRDEVAARLLEIVRDRTGYPAEMLRLDLDLEADLGIDSIKRVEILGSLRDALPPASFGSGSEMMDQLSRAQTLGAIVDRVDQALQSTRDGVATEAATVHVPTNGRAAAPDKEADGRAEPVRRLVLQAVEAPLRRSPREPGLVPGGVVLISDDGRGVARDLAADLRARGHVVVRVAHDPEPGGDIHGDEPRIDLTEPGQVDGLFRALRSRGPLTAIIHLLPLRPGAPAGLDDAAWSGRMRAEVAGLFCMARAGGDDLARAAGQGGACLIAATGLGGGFASVAGPPVDFFPGSGAVAGLVKTLAREWPAEVRVRVVDLDPRDPAEVLAANIEHEIRAADGRAEVGYLDRRRVALQPVEEGLTRGSGPAFELEPGEPLLLTGGARGITARIAADLAARWRPTLLLVGMSPLPPDAESATTAGVDCPATLKSLLHQKLSRDGGEVGPAALERAYQALGREREIRANLAALRSLGCTVDYAEADVRDVEALGRVLAAWRSRFGPLKGFVHGAGVIQDKLLRDKTLASFDRVLGTKVEGALNLARLVDPSALKFAAFFSSVAGRFGNRGQADYAAANETLNKLAIWLDRRWPGRVVSLIWGPWSGVGMVSDLESHLARQGLGMIAPAQGVHRLAEELRLGRKGAVEVIVAGEIGPLLYRAPDPNPRASEPARRGPAVARTS